jgi:hypothetical protein
MEKVKEIIRFFESFKEKNKHNVNANEILNGEDYCASQSLMLQDGE